MPELFAEVVKNQFRIDARVVHDRVLTRLNRKSIFSILKHLGFSETEVIDIHDPMPCPDTEES